MIEKLAKEMRVNIRRVCCQLSLREIGFYIILFASIAYLVLSISYWWLVITTNGESPLLSAILMGLLYGLPPLVIVGLCHYWLALGSLIAVGASIAMTIYCVFDILFGSVKVNPIFDYMGLFLCIEFLVGGAIMLVSSTKTNDSLTNTW